MAEKTSLTNNADVTENTDDIETAATDTDADDTAQIREQIEETRQGMGETIRAIEEKLSISNISEQVKEQVSEQITNAVETVKDNVYVATVGRAGEFMKKAGNEISRSDLFKKAQSNPLPLALIGLGVGLLLFGGSKSRSSNRSYRYGKFADKGQSSGDSTIKTAQKKLGETYDSISQTAGDAYASAGDAASQSYQKVGEYGSQVRDTYNRQIEENPLAVGVAAFAVGAVLGLAIPSTDYESQLMGETRQNLVQKVQSSANDLIDKVKDVAGEAGRTITEEAKSQGLRQ
jgi:Protein of unknown function (DUF3618)